MNSKPAIEDVITKNYPWIEFSFEEIVRNNEEPSRPFWVIGVAVVLVFGIVFWGKVRSKKENPLNNQI